VQYLTKFICVCNLSDFEIFLSRNLQDATAALIEKNELKENYNISSAKLERALVIMAILSSI